MSWTESAKSTAQRFLPHPLYRMYRRRRVAKIISRYEPRDHAGIYGGHQLTLRFADPLAEAWYGHDWPVLPEIRELRDRGRLGQGANVFDLGAHQGLVALLLAREVGTQGQVVAVEGEAHNARIAGANMTLNAADNVIVLHAAVGAEVGRLPFAEGLNGSVDEGTTLGNVEVDAVTIDALAEQYGMPDVVFIDVEGYEGKALRGASHVIASGASFFVEIHVDQLVDSTPLEIIETFAGRELYVAENSGGETEEYNFVPHDGRVPTQRFYLVAI